MNVFWILMAVIVTNVDDKAVSTPFVMGTYTTQRACERKIPEAYSRISIAQAVAIRDVLCVKVVSE